MPTRTLIALTLLLAGCQAQPPARSHGRAPAPVNAVDPLDRLKEGNARYAAAESSAGKPVRARRAQTARTQHPFAVVVGCADSRTAPEIVFDQGLGDLFVIRTAGSLVDEHALGSLEYAVEHLGVRLVVVLAHERCGAVKAAFEGAEAPGHVASLVRDIRPAVAAAKGSLEGAVNENARLVAKRIRAEAHFGTEASEVRVVAACYDLDTGMVAWLAD